MTVEIPQAVVAFGEWFNDAPGVATGTTVVHLLAMLWSGGISVATDRQLLRADANDASRRTQVVREVTGAHAAVIAGLVASVLTGLAMAAADAETYVVSPVYWAKMAAFAALLVNGVLMTRVEGRAASDATAFRRLRTHGTVSFVGWVTLCVLGVLLVNP